MRDDFGFTAGVNRAIVEAHSRGIVTSSTLMANGIAFADAVELAHSVLRLSVGCHVVLIDGEPVLPAHELPSLTRGGRFRDGLKTFAARALAARIDDEEVFAEATAQIRRIQSAGIRIAHFDTHKHTHLFPRILRPVLRNSEGVWSSGGAQSVWTAVAHAIQRTSAAPESVDALCGAAAARGICPKVSRGGGQRGLRHDRWYSGNRSHGHARRVAVPRYCRQHSRRDVGVCLPSRLQ